MSALRLWLCRVIGHAALPGTDPARALVYHCERCHRLIPGGMAVRRPSW